MTLPRAGETEAKEGVLLGADVMVDHPDNAAGRLAPRFWRFRFSIPEFVHEERVAATVA